MWWIGTKAAIDAANAAATAALPDDRNAATGQVVPDVTMRWAEPYKTLGGVLWAMPAPPNMTLPVGLTAQGSAPDPEVSPLP